MSSLPVDSRRLTLAERATRLQPEPRTFDTLGWIRFQRGEPDEAAEALTRAVEEGPDAPEIRYRWGRVLAAKGDRDGALREYRRALDAGPFPQADAARGEIARLEMGEPGIP